MKIEMGESLMMSYLKHVKNCMLYQTNWKIAKSWKRTEDADKKAKELFKKIKEKLEFSFVIETDFEQTLQQAEIDAIGIDCSGKVYFVDVAFHEAGLNYGSKEETNKRVMKKFLRTYMAALAYFPEYKYEIIFASPKVNPAVNEIISQFFNSMKNNFSDENVEFKYIANENFRNEILIPTIKEANLNSDTAELFMRSIKMLELFEMVNFTEDKTEETPISISDTHVQSTNNQSVFTRNEEFELTFIPNDEKLFKQLLLKTKKAKRTFYYKNGSQKIEIWDASGFTVESNLKGNIYSGKLRNRVELGIIKAVFEIIQ